MPDTVMFNAVIAACSWDVAIGDSLAITMRSMVMQKSLKCVRFIRVISDRGANEKRQRSVGSYGEASGFRRGCILFLDASVSKMMAWTDGHAKL